MDLHEPGSNLSTPWPAYYFKNLHIPLSYEMPLLTAQLSTPPDPPFPTPVAFGDFLEVGGWKDKRPSWVVAVLQLVPLKFTTQVCILSRLGLFLFANMLTAVQKLRLSCCNER